MKKKIGKKFKRDSAMGFPLPSGRAKTRLQTEDDIVNHAVGAPLSAPFIVLRPGLTCKVSDIHGVKLRKGIAEIKNVDDVFPARTVTVKVDLRMASVRERLLGGGDPVVMREAHLQGQSIYVNEREKLSFFEQLSPHVIGEALNDVSLTLHAYAFPTANGIIIGNAALVETVIIGGNLTDEIEGMLDLSDVTKAVELALH